MKSLTTLIVRHIKGTSGYTNAMIEQELKQRYLSLDDANRHRIRCIIDSYLQGSTDEDVVATSAWLLLTLRP